MLGTTLQPHRQRSAPNTRGLLIAVFIALAPMAGLAQQTTPTDQSSAIGSGESDSITAPPAEQQNKSPAPPTQNKTKTNNRRFKPSESISEDLSVAFPVDI